MSASSEDVDKMIVYDFNYIITYYFSNTISIGEDLLVT
jgi:hypothetical protein